MNEEMKNSIFGCLSTEEIVLENLGESCFLILVFFYNCVLNLFFTIYTHYF